MWIGFRGVARISDWGGAGASEANFIWGTGAKILKLLFITTDFIAWEIPCNNPYMLKIEHILIYTNLVDYYQIIIIMIVLTVECLTVPL